VLARAPAKVVRRSTGPIGGNDRKGCDEPMMGKFTLGAATLFAAALMTPVSAAPLSSLTPAAAPADGLVEQVRRRGRGHFRGGRSYRHFRGGRSHRHFRGGRSYRHFRYGRRHRHAHRWHRHRHHRHRRWGWAGVPFFYGGYYGSCSTTRYRCAARYGWHTGGYYRCVWRHGC
jgi:hypothetical protein